jgi:hypothetical protein
METTTMSEWKVMLIVTPYGIEVATENISNEEGMLAALQILQNRYQTQDQHPLVRDYLKLGQTIAEYLKEEK